MLHLRQAYCLGLLLLCTCSVLPASEGVLRETATLGESEFAYSGHLQTLLYCRSTDCIITQADHVSVWDAKTGHISQHFRNPGGPCDHVAISEDGKIVVTARNGPGVDQEPSFAYCSVEAWSCESGSPVNDFQRDGSFITALSLKEDGSEIVTGDEDGRVELWKMSSGAWLWTCTTTDASVTCLSTSQPSLIAAGCGDGSLVLIDGNNGSQVKSWRAHTGAVRDVVVSNNKQWLVTAGDDGTVRTWSIATGREDHSRRVRFRDYVQDVSLSGDGLLMAGAAWHPSGLVSVQVWNMQNGKIKSRAKFSEPVHRVLPTPLSRRSVSLSFRENEVIIATRNGGLRYWHWKEGKLGPQFRRHCGYVTALKFLDNTELLSGGSDYAVGLWDIRTNSQKAKCAGHESCIDQMSAKDDGTLFASLGTTELICWSKDTTDQIKRWDFVRDDVMHAVAFRKGDGHLVGVTSSMSLIEWNFRSRVFHRLRTGEVGWRGERACIASDCSIAVISSGKSMRVVDLALGAYKVLPEVHKYNVRRIEMSSNGSIMVSMDKETVAVWDLERNEVICKRPSEDGQCFAISHSGRYLALACRSNIQLVDVSSGRTICQLVRPSDSGQPTSLCFSPDSLRLAIGLSTGRIRICGIQK